MTDTCCRPRCKNPGAHSVQILVWSNARLDHKPAVFDLPFKVCEPCSRMATADSFLGDGAFEMMCKATVQRSGVEPLRETAQLKLVPIYDL